MKLARAAHVLASLWFMMGHSSSKHSKHSKHSVPRPPKDVPLPVEVYGRIFEFVKDPQDLLSLCLVSRMFYQEAERVLYGSVDLSDNHLIIKRWFEKMANNPRLAVLVRSVSFGFVYGHIPPNPSSWLEIIRDGLRSLINLKELNLSRTSNRFIPSRYVGILTDHPFQLEAFRNSMFDVQHTLDFLASQPELTVWHQSGSTPCELPDGILPHLTDVSLSPRLLAKLSSRPITRISSSIQFEDADAERQFIDMLGVYGGKLTSLGLERDVTDGCLSTAEMIRLLAVKLPLLECLSVRVDGELRTDSTTPQVAAALSAFPKLTTLTLFPDHAFNTDSFNYDVLTTKNRRKAASQFFKASSSLTRIALPFGINLVWHARSHNHSMVGDYVVR